MLVDRPIQSTRPQPIATARVPDAAAPAPTRARLPLTALGVVAAGLVVVGALAPWLSFFAGLQPIRGTDGPWGLVLAGLGLAAGAIATVHLFTAHPSSRWLLAGAGFGVLTIAAPLGVMLLAEFRMLAADPLLIARIEPGLGIVLLGGSLLAATSFVPIITPGETAPTRPAPSTRIVLAGVVLAAGLVHLLLTQEHLADSVPLGVGFLVVGVMQTAVAALLLLTRTRGPIAAALLVSAGSAVALLAAVTVGLPLIGHGMASGPLGPVEALDDVAGLTLLAEVGAVVLSIRLLRRP